MRDVSIAGIGQTKVGEHWDVSLRHLALEATLAALAEHLPARRILIGRELTKLFEQIVVLPAADGPAWLAADASHGKGEFVLVVEGDHQVSGFLTLAFDPMKQTVAALRAAGLSDVKVMVGGGQINEQIRDYAGADAYGRDAMAAVALAKDWV